MTVRHVVLFDYADSASEADIQQVIAGLNALPDEIPTILDWSMTEDMGKREGSFRFCLIAHFETMADVDAYLAHPAHVKAVEKALPILIKLAEHDHKI